MGTGVRCKTQGVRCKTQGVRCKTQGVRCKTQGVVWVVWVSHVSMKHTKQCHQCLSICVLFASAKPPAPSCMVQSLSGCPSHRCQSHRCLNVWGCKAVLWLRLGRTASQRRGIWNSKRQIDVVTFLKQFVCVRLFSVASAAS